MSVDDLIDYLEISGRVGRESAPAILKSVLAVYPDRVPWLDSFETSFLRERPPGSFKLIGGLFPKTLAGVGLFVTDKLAIDILNRDVREVVDLGNGYLKLKPEKIKRRIFLSDLEELSDKKVI